MMKRLLKLLLALLLALNVGVPLASAQAPSDLNLTLSSEPPSLDPGVTNDSTSVAILHNVFEGLTNNVDGEVEPGVAESWEISEDGLVYTFHLRDNVVWSNGDPVTAHDFEYSWKRVLNPDTAAQNSTVLHIIQGAEAYNTGEGTADEVGIKAIDDYTLEVTLEHPAPYFIELPGYYTLLPVHQATVEASDAWATEAGDGYVSNGPYILSEWNHNSDLTLSRNDAYWDNANTTIDSAFIQIIESEATQNAEYQAGNLSYLGAPFGSVSLDSVDLYRANGELQANPYSAIYWYKVNTTDEIMQNVNIRKALALAINRQELIDNILKSEQIPAMSLVPPVVKGFEEKHDYFQDADFEQARQYLAQGLEELGMSDPSELTINLSINDSEAHSAVAQFIQAGWATELGINTNIDSTEWQVYLDKVSNLDYQVARLGWIGAYNDATIFLNQYRAVDTGNNDTGWENPDFTRLMNESDQEQDDAQRIQLMKDAEAVMMKDMPVIPLYFYSNDFVTQAGYENLEPNAFGYIQLKHVTLAD